MTVLKQLSAWEGGGEGQRQNSAPRRNQRKGIIGGEVFQNCAFVSLSSGAVINFHRKASSFALGLPGLSALIARFSHCFSRVHRDGRPPREGEGGGVGVGEVVGEVVEEVGVEVSTAHRLFPSERREKGTAAFASFLSSAWIRDFFLIME